MWSDSGTIIGGKPKMQDCRIRSGAPAVLRKGTIYLRSHERGQ